MMNDKTFFRFVRFCLGDPSETPEMFKDMDWPALWQMAVKQSLIGFFFDGIRRMPKQLMPRYPLLLEWIGQSGRLENRNRAACEAIGEMCRLLQADGFRTCLLKGECAGLRYPSPLLRKPGDIDLWVLPADGSFPSLAGRRRQIMAYLQQKGVKYDVAPHHIGFKRNGFEYELHVTPITHYSPLHNHRLQQWFMEKADDQFSNIVTLPNGKDHCAASTARFDAVYQLSHIFHHVFDGGISLRLFLDYYYVVMDPGFEVDGAAFAAVLKKVGLYHIAQGMSYVMQTLFHLPADRYPIPASKKIGEKIIRQMMEGGEFGAFGKDAGIASRSVRKYVNDTRRSLSLLTTFPSEAFFNPVLHIRRYLWGLINKQR